MLLFHTMSTINEYLKTIQNRLSANFDFTENYSIESFTFNWLASFNSKNTKYAISKEIKIYSFETNEYFLFKSADSISTTVIQNEVEAVKRHLPELVRPHGEHMSSQLLMVYIMEDEIPEEISKLAQQTKYQKGFAFGFKGWVDMGLVVYSLKNNRVVTHKKFMKAVTFLTSEKAV